MNGILSLLASRKFWITVAAVASAVGAKLDGAITGTHLVAAVMAGAIALVGAIAHEDAGKVVVANDNGVQK